MLNYSVGQVFIVKNDMIVSEDFDNLLMRKGSDVTITHSKYGEEFPYLVKFSSHDYQMAMTEDEIDIYFDIK